MNVFICNHLVRNGLIWFIGLVNGDYEVQMYGRFPGHVTGIACFSSKLNQSEFWVPLNVFWKRTEKKLIISKYRSKKVYLLGNSKSHWGPNQALCWLIRQLTGYIYIIRLYLFWYPGVSAITHFKHVHYFRSKKSKISKYQKVNDKPGLGIMDIIFTVPMFELHTKLRKWQHGWPWSFIAVV